MANAITLGVRTISQKCGSLLHISRERIPNKTDRAIRHCPLIGIIGIREEQRGRQNFENSSPPRDLFDLSEPQIKLRERHPY
jgi:hypothetical protein